MRLEARDEENALLGCTQNKAQDARPHPQLETRGTRTRARTRPPPRDPSTAFFFFFASSPIPLNQVSGQNKCTIVRPGSVAGGRAATREPTAGTGGVANQHSRVAVRPPLMLLAVKNERLRGVPHAHVEREYGRGLSEQRAWCAFAHVPYCWICHLTRS